MPAIVLQVGKGSRERAAIADKRIILIWLIKFAMRVLMPRSDSLPGIESTDIDGFLRRMRLAADPRYWLGLVVGAVIFMVSPLLTVGVPLPAVLLPPRLLAKHAQRLVAHPRYLLRQSVLLVRISAAMCWGSDPAVRAHFALAPYAPDPGTYRVA
jgi:hypothetical protein